mgnify:CR=1 FL=1
MLGNEPGVYSARYAGVHGNDEANNQKLVEVLHPYRGEARRGHYSVRDCCRVAGGGSIDRGRQM